VAHAFLLNVKKRAPQLNFLALENGMLALLPAHLLPKQVGAYQRTFWWVVVD
jgi:hypothetical protein